MATASGVSIELGPSVGDGVSGVTVGAGVATGSGVLEVVGTEVGVLVVGSGLGGSFESLFHISAFNADRKRSSGSSLCLMLFMRGTSLKCASSQRSPDPAAHGSSLAA